MWVRMFCKAIRAAKEERRLEIARKMARKRVWEAAMLLSEQEIGIVVDEFMCDHVVADNCDCIPIDAYAAIREVVRLCSERAATNVLVLRIQELRAVGDAAAVREAELRQVAESYQRWANFSERELAKVGVQVNADGTMTNIRAESAEAQLRECEQERDEYKAEWEALAEEEEVESEA